MKDRVDNLEQEFWKLDDELGVFADKCVAVLNERQLVRSKLSNIELASLTLFKKAFDSFQSILLLHKENFRIDSAVILRHLINILIMFMRVTKHDEGESEDYWANRYIEWMWVDEFKELQKIKSGESESIVYLLSRELEINENYSRVKKLYSNEEGRLSRYWYGESIKQCAEDLCISPSYESGYSPLSGLEHADYFSLSRLDEEPRFRLHYVATLMSNFSHFIVIVKRIAEDFQLLDTQCLEDMFQRVKKLESMFNQLLEDMKTS